MSDRRYPRPLQQGALDSLCGIYALINAIRCVHGNRIPRLNGRDLFKLILRHAERVVTLDDLLTDGIEPALLWRLVKASVQEINTTFGTAFATNRPYARGPRPTIEVLHAAMAIEFSARSAGYIICLTGRHNHWTVVKRVAAQSFILCDSDGLCRVHLDRCCVGSDKGGSSVQCHVVDPRLIICISA